MPERLCVVKTKAWQLTERSEVSAAETLWSFKLIKQTCTVCVNTLCGLTDFKISSMSPCKNLSFNSEEMHLD